MSRTLAEATIRAATRFLDQPSEVARGVSATTTALPEEVIRIMTSKTPTQAAAVLLAAWASSAALVVARDEAPSSDARPPAVTGPGKTSDSGPRPVMPEAPGNASFMGRGFSPERERPGHARARLGTTRLRHLGVVNSVAFAPDGRTLASAGWDGVRFWNRATGEPWANLPVIREDGGTYVAAYSPGGTRLAIGRDGIVQVWDLAAGKECSRTRFHPGRVWEVAFAPDGRTLASTSDADSKVRLWDVASGRELRSLACDVESLSPRPLAFSRDGKRLAMGGRPRAPVGKPRPTDGEVIYVWNLDGGDPLIIRDAHEWWLFSLTFAAEGTLISAGCAFERVPGPAGGDERKEAISQIRVWDARSGRKLRDLDLGAAPGMCKVALSRDGKTMISAHRDRLLAWEMPAGKLVRTVPIEDQEDSPMCRGVAVSPEGRTIGAVRGDHAVHLWDGETGEPLPARDGSNDTLVYSVAISPDGRLVATGDDKGSVRLWDPIRGDVLHRLRAGERARVWAVRFAPDGRTLASASEDSSRPSEVDRGVVRLWDLPSLRLRHELRVDHRAALVEFSPDGRRLAVASWDSKRQLNNAVRGVGEPIGDVIGVFDVATGKKEMKLRGHDKLALEIAFAQDGKMLASAGQDDTFRFWDLETGRMVREIAVGGHRRSLPARGPGITNRIGSVAFSADLKTAASSLPLDGNLFVWDLGAGRTRRSKRDDPSLVWDLRAGWTRRTIQAEVHSRDVLAISPDGRLLARAILPFSGDPDPPIRIWDMKTKREVLRLEPGASGPLELAFSADGKTLVSGMRDTTAIVWDVSPAYETLNRRRD